MAISGADVAELRKEMEEQELIQALGKERGMQEQHMAEARREAADLRRHLEVRRPPPTPSTDDARLQELLNVQAQLQDERAEAAVQQRAVREQVEQLQGHNTDLQARLAAASQAAMQAELQMARLREEHAQQTAHLQSQLCFHAGSHQELLLRDDDLVRQQAQAILQLEAQLLQADREREEARQQPVGAAAPSPAAMGAGSPRTPSTGRLAALEQENAALREALQEANPDSCLAAIITAAHPSGRQEAVLKALQGKLAQLQEVLAAQDGEAQRKLRAVQREHERLLAAHNGRWAWWRQG